MSNMCIRKSIIACLGQNRELGKRGSEQMLWRIAEDFAHFKEVTMGKPVIMGLHTFRSIGRPLPGRPNIVLTKNKNAVAVHDVARMGGVTLAESLPEAYKIAEATAVELEVDEIFNIGGGSVYAQGLRDADRLYLTRVDTAFPEADVFFPEYEHTFTKVIDVRMQSNNQFTFEFVILEK
jgi:dihydrofolate reductase